MKKFYITTSIVYTNAFPHIGFALEIIQADVVARYHRNLNEDVFYLTGTDEHGSKISRTAQLLKKEPKEFVDEISLKYKKLGKILNLSNNDFIRTSDQKKHWPTVEKVWNKLKENDDIYKKKYQGLYCIGCEAFITKKDLKDGKCILHKKEPEKVEEENYFFRLSKYSEQIKELIEKEKIKIVPKTRKNELLGFIKQGLEDISFSRPSKDLKWGIPVPDDDSQTIYVWADALTNYLSALDYQNNGEKFKKYWPADVHCIGKDILKFHGLFWPAMLLSLDLSLPKTIFVHGFISVDGQKMSKSLGNVVDPFELVEKYGTDAIRYFLLSEIPSTEDGDFSYQKFEARYNSDLAGGIGNLVARTRGMIKKRKVRKEKINIIIQNSKLEKKIKEVRNNYIKAIDGFKFNTALKLIWELIGFCDRYIEQEKPWEQKEGSDRVLFDLLYTLKEIADLLKPFLPETSEKIFKEIEIDEKKEDFKNKESKILFPRVDN
ncbi:MAG: methionine--tRNA ligase [Candidatus Nealsonbacteria bacterium]